MYFPVARLWDLQGVTASIYCEGQLSNSFTLHRILSSLPCTASPCTAALPSLPCPGMGGVCWRWCFDEPFGVLRSPLWLLHTLPSLFLKQSLYQTCLKLPAICSAGFLADWLSYPQPKALSPILGTQSNQRESLSREHLKSHCDCRALELGLLNLNYKFLSYS